MSRHRRSTTTGTPRTVRLLTAPAAGALAVGFLSVLLPANAFAADRDCGDFASQADAQAYFTANGGSGLHNVDRLDANHNGVACENQVYTGVSSSSRDGADGGADDAVDGAPVGAPETGDGSTGSGPFRLF